MKSNGITYIDFDIDIEFIKNKNKNGAPGQWMTKSKYWFCDHDLCLIRSYSIVTDTFAQAVILDIRRIYMRIS